MEIFASEALSQVLLPGRDPEQSLEVAVKYIILFKFILKFMTWNDMCDKGTAQQTCLKLDMRC